MEIPASEKDHFRTLGRPIADEAAGERLDAFLAANFPFFSRASWQRRVDDGAVRINARPARTAYRLRPGDRITYLHPPEIEPEVTRELPVLWKDRHVMAVEKPPHMPIHENGPYFHHTLTKMVQQAHGRNWYPVHRLDKETSGVVLCGGTPEVRAGLAKDFQTGRVRKQYIAVINGNPAWDEFVNEAAIGGAPAGSRIRIKKWVDDDGLPAKTIFHCLERRKTAALILAEPKTGRTNQIRIHLAHIGHPIIGDKLYHPDERVFLTYAEDKKIAEAAAMAGHDRLCLHAFQLVFRDPSSQSWCLAESAIPPDFRRLLDTRD